MAEKRKFYHCVRHSAALGPFCKAEKKNVIGVGFVLAVFVCTCMHVITLIQVQKFVTVNYSLSTSKYSETSISFFFLPQSMKLIFLLRNYVQPNKDGNTEITC